MAETVSIDRPSVACLSTAVQKARGRQRVGISAAPRLQQGLCRQAQPRSMSRL
jgi:hypothetical protein